MKKFISTAKQFVGGLLAQGEHLVTVKEVADELSKQSGSWSDRTQQIRVVFENAKGTITKWYNMVGYKDIKDFPTGIAPKGFEFRSSENGQENYLVNIKTNERVISEEKTATAERIFCELASDAGIDAGEEFSAEDLVGQELGIMVRSNNRNGVEVHYTMIADRIQATA